jgi:hypothetical protein
MYQSSEEGFNISCDEEARRSEIEASSKHFKIRQTRLVKDPKTVNWISNQDVSKSYQPPI